MVAIANTPYFSQNVSIYFAISRNNGQSWSKAINISNTTFANRGFQSMALDTVTGNLVFGWYDGRNDPTYMSLEYYATYIPAEVLDKLVDEIPLSDPVYDLPTATIPPGLTGVNVNAIVANSDVTYKLARKERVEKTTNNNNKVIPDIAPVAVASAKNDTTKNTNAKRLLAKKNARL